MHAQRKPSPSTRYHLPEGTRRELRGQVVQWRGDALEQRAAAPTEQLLKPAMSAKAEKLGLALVAIGVLLVIVLRVEHVL